MLAIRIFSLLQWIVSPSQALSAKSSGQQMQLSLPKYCLKSERGIERKHDNRRKNGYRYEEH
jgi:hypothetical protein